MGYLNGIYSCILVGSQNVHVVVRTCSLLTGYCCVPSKTNLLWMISSMSPPQTKTKGSVCAANSAKHRVHRYHSYWLWESTVFRPHYFATFHASLTGPFYLGETGSVCCYCRIKSLHNNVHAPFFWRLSARCLFFFAFCKRFNGRGFNIRSSPLH